MRIPGGEPGILTYARLPASGRTGLLTLALTQNMPLVGLLIAVSFLQLVSTQPGSAREPLTTHARLSFSSSAEEYPSYNSAGISPRPCSHPAFASVRTRSSRL